jgi:hypothetical protein
MEDSPISKNKVDHHHVTDAFGPPWQSAIFVLSR